MQYGADMMEYKRVTKEDKNEKAKISKRDIVKFIGLFVCSFLISRVCLINNTAPFGISFVAATGRIKRLNYSLCSAFGAFVGYVTLVDRINNLWLYLFLIAAIVLYNLIAENKSIKEDSVFIGTIILIIEIIYTFIVHHYSINVIIITTLLDVITIIPIFLLLIYSINSFKNINTRHIYSSEETIAMAILLALMISGTWGVQVYGISFTNIIAIIITMVLAYINGSAVGASIGAAVGIICGMSTNSMIDYISLLALVGLATGIFKELGKIVSSLAAIISIILLLIYSKFQMDFSMIEALISVGIFLLIPGKVYERFKKELNINKKEEILKENYNFKIKEIYKEKLNDFSKILHNISKVLDDLADNDKLAMKQKSTRIVENLADRVCSSCNMYNICWKREFYLTHSAFQELLEQYDYGAVVLPDELERKCVKRTVLIKNAEELMNNFIISEMWRQRLCEGREILSNQIENMGRSVEEISEEFNEEVSFNGELEELLIHNFNKNGVRYYDLMCFKTRENRIVIKMEMESCGGSQGCVKDVLPILKRVIEKNMCVGDEGCSINPNTNRCTVSFEETPKYHVVSYVGTAAKNQEKIMGDSYTFNKLKDGSYMVMISDGMGSGPQAGKESNAVVELIEKFTLAGLSKSTSINTVNSIMNMKFEEDEKYSTVDLSTIDLYEGEVEFIKIGAAASFIKKKDQIEVINSKTLPIGVLDKPDIDVVKSNVENGDFIIMVSDGVIDYNGDNTGKPQWIVEYLKEMKTTNPKELVENIIKKAKELSGGKVKDDMTAIVSRVYNVY